MILRVVVVDYFNIITRNYCLNKTALILVVAFFFLFFIFFFFFFVFFQSIYIQCQNCKLLSLFIIAQIDKISF